MNPIFYLFYLTVPGAVYLSLTSNGWMTFFALIYAFGIIPGLELLVGTYGGNHPQKVEEKLSRVSYYDWLLYLNVPLQFLFLGMFLFRVSQGDNSLIELLGLTLSMGASCAVVGINAAHELGHRSKVSEQRMAQALLFSSLYMHFFIEHNRGHHKNVSTPLDPASSQIGESLYAFLPKTIVGGFASAYKIDPKQFSYFMLVQVLGVLVVGLIFGPIASLFFIAVGAIGMLFLESVNYIEHYGLKRKEVAPGKFERTRPHHSWNSNHLIGRIILLELTRHSDHHAHPGRKFQILRHFESAPQLPTGYPGMMLLATIPPLWFKIMNPRLPKA